MGGPQRGFFERLRVRLGRWYFHALFGVLVVVVVAVVVPVYSALLIPYFGATRDEYVRVVLSFELVMAAAGVGTVAGALARHRPVVRWLAGERDPEAAAAAWSSVVGDFPRTAAMLCVWYAALCVPPAVYVSDFIGLSTTAAVGYCVVLAILVVGVTVAGFLVFEQALRPVAREAAAVMPAGTRAGHRPAGLGVKVLVLIPAINLFLCMVVAMVSSNSDTLEARIFVTAGSALVVSLTLSVGLTLMLRRALLGRLDELRGAMARVDAGDLSVRLAQVAGDELDEVGRSFNVMVGGLQERATLHAALGSYVDASIADRIARDGAVVDGEQVDVSVLVADIREFTWLVDRSAPQHVVAYLNEFFGLVLPVLKRHGGHANKLLGDGVLAVFGAPMPLPDHARRAVDAAVELVATVRERYGGELRVGVGVSSGPVIAGTVGGPGKLDYTVIGDAVNVASRVEALTKELGVPLLVTEETRARLGDGVALSAMGRHAVRGKPRGVEVYTLPEDARVAGPQSV